MASTTSSTYSTNLGALTTPLSTPPGGCFSTWVATNENTHWYQLGPTSGAYSMSLCQPSAWSKGDVGYFSPGVCPEGFMTIPEGCNSLIDGGVATAATCCPSGFACRTETWVTDDTQNLCTKLLTGDEPSITLDYYVHEPGQKTPVETWVTATSLTAGQFIGARGLVVRRSEGDPTWPGWEDDDAGEETTSSDGSSRNSRTTSNSSSGSGSSTSGPSSSAPATTTTTSSKPQTSSPSSAYSSSADDTDTSPPLTTGAIAGIAVGCSVGTLLVATSMFWAYWVGRKRRREQDRAASSSSSSNDGDGRESDKEVMTHGHTMRQLHETNGEDAVWEIDDWRRCAELEQPMAEPGGNGDPGRRW